MKILKEWTVSYLSSDVTFTNLSKRKAEPKPLEWIINAVLQGFSVLHSKIQGESVSPLMEVEFSKADASSEIEWLFINMGVSGMLEDKFFDDVDMFFPVVVGFVDRATGYRQSSLIELVHIMYSELLNKLTKDWNEEGAGSDMLLYMKADVQRL